MIEISAVSYLNALPMVYGLQRGPNASLWSVRLELPAQSAKSLRDGVVGLALMPVGALHAVPGARVLGGYCVGAAGDVYTVCLCAHSEMAGLRKIYLDPDSRTSVQLVQILAKRYWNIAPLWRPLGKSKLEEGFAPDEGVVLIGDKVFNQRGRFEVCHDLAAEWIAFTGLPFVFAAWAATQPVPQGVAKALNDDIAWGIAHLRDAVEARAADQGLPCTIGEAEYYLHHNIDFRFTDDKQKGLQSYLALREELARENPIGGRL